MKRTLNLKKNAWNKKKNHNPNWKKLKSEQKYLEDANKKLKLEKEPAK